MPTTHDRHNWEEMAFLLRAAAAEMMAFGPAPILSSYDTCEGIGHYLEKTAAKFANRDDSELRELFRIFAPTSEWDDARGSNQIADEVFAVLSWWRGEDEEMSETELEVELARRAEEIKSDKEVGIPAEQVFSELRKKYSS